MPWNVGDPMLDALNPLTGSGSPEGVQVGVQGQHYIDIVAGEVWVKTTDGGTTGWSNASAGGGGAHATSHSDGGADEVDVIDLAAAGAAGFIPERDGLGGLQWVSTPVGGGSPSSDMFPHPVQVTQRGTSAFAYHFHGATPTLITSGTNHATVLQAAIDYLQENGGGTVKLRGLFDIATTLVVRAVRAAQKPAEVWPTRGYPIRLLGDGDLLGYSATAGAFGDPSGTELKWTGAAGGRILELGDANGGAHKCIVEGLTFDGDNNTNELIKMTGNQIRLRACTFRRPGTDATDTAVLVVGNDESTGDWAAGTRMIDCQWYDGGWGVRVLDEDWLGGPAVANATDGRIFASQMNGPEDGWVYLGRGGWQIALNHFTNTAAATMGIDIQAGGPHMIDANYLDTIGSGPTVRINGSQAAINNNHFQNSKSVPSAFVEHVSGSHFQVTGNKWQGLGGSETFFFETADGTPSGTVADNRGPTDPGFAASSEADSSTGNFRQEFTLDTG